MKKNYVLDTNVLLHDPDALVVFEDNNLNIPITVIEEIDRFKKNSDEIGRNARHVSRFLDELRLQGDLKAGVANDKGGRVRVRFGREFADRLPAELSVGKGDNRILAVCLSLQEEEPELPVVFVTKDTNLRIKANVLGINAEDYERGKVSLEELYTGTAEATVARASVDQLFREGGTQVEGDLFANQFVCLLDETNPSHTALGRHRGQGRVTPLRIPKEPIWGIQPRNREQRYALDVLLDDEIKLVTLVGKAGTGKTLLAIAAGLQKAVEEQVYKRLLVSRPIFPMGRDIGFLPGDVQEKLRPWMQPIFDNVDFLFAGSQGRDGKRTRGYQELIEMDLMALEPLTYIRGRSIPYQYLIVDEAQNLTPHEIKTIITRAGEGTKIVLTGDPYQIDNPYIDSTSNGLTYCVERFKGQVLAGHVTLAKGERSALAELAANVL